MKRWEYYAYAIADEFFLAGGDRDDLRQESLIGLLNAIRGYEPSRGTFKSFLILCVKRHLCTVVKTADRGKHRGKWPFTVEGNAGTLEGEAQSKRLTGQEAQTASLRFPTSEVPSSHGWQAAGGCNTESPAGRSDSGSSEGHQDGSADSQAGDGRSSEDRSRQKADLAGGAA